MNTMPLEAATRQLIDTNLRNLGWEFTGKNQNVFLEQPKTEKERKRLGGKRPDYVLYSKDSDTPLIIIEAKKKGERIDSALEQGIFYAKQLEAPLVYATDGVFCKSFHTLGNTTPKLNGEDVDEFVREALALKFLASWEVNTVSPKVQYDRKELIKIFDEANNMLRGDGLRAGIERFGEFANILFLKLISENGQRRIDYSCSWDAIKQIPPTARIDYINSTVYKNLNTLYGTDIFTPLTIRDNVILKEIMDKLDPLTLTDVDSDVKGDAFEYFLKASTASKNDLGEYFTPRHIVKTMVRLVNPQIGEKIYDPFCGTGGFLIESFRHIYNNMARTDRNIKELRESTIYGNEITNTARITKMNMILAGDGHSNIHMTDSLANPVDGEYDIVLANMPYSQKTKYGNLYDLPSTNGDSICVQHCMKAINSASENGRIALVVPEGFLFRKDLSKAREYILENCQLQSIISLPQGVFLPYTGVKTNIIFATKVNQKLKLAEKRKDFWCFDVKSDGYTLDSHRRKLETPSDLSKYEEYRKLDNDQKNDMLQVGFEIIPLDKVRDNSFILVGSRYREQKNIFSKYENFLLSDVATFVRGLSFPKSAQKTNKTDDCLGVVTTRAAQSEGIDEKHIVYIDNSYIRDEKLLNKGDILISLANSLPLVGRVTFVNNSYSSLSFGAFMGIVRADQSRVLPKLLFYILQSSYAKDYFLANAKTTTNISNLTFEDLSVFSIPLPPLDIQQQIVDELSSYQSVIDGARAILGNYKPKIQIRDSWAKMKLVDISSELKVGFACGIHNKTENGILHIRPMNITSKGALTFEGSKYIDSENMTKREQYLLKKGDVLFNNTNSKELIGKSCCIEQEIIALYSNHITRIRVNPQFANPKFVAIQLHNKWESRYFEEYCRKWIGQAGFDLTELSNLELSIPSIEIQNDIVARIETEQALIEPSERLIEVFTRKIQDKINEIFN